METSRLNDTSNEYNLSMIHLYKLTEQRDKMARTLTGTQPNRIFRDKYGAQRDVVIPDWPCRDVARYLEKKSGN